MSESYRLSVFLLFAAAIIFTWSAIAPYDRTTWWMEVAPVLIALPILIASYNRFTFTTLIYGLIFIHAVILMIGGHYTYARVPFFEFFGEDRNNFDKLGHFAQGFIPAMIMRELVIRTSPLRTGKWLFAIIVFSCLGISAAYELIEWAAAMILGQGADEFLGTQGDVWDTQKDMAWAGAGAVIALLVLSRWHDRLLARQIRL